MFVKRGIGWKMNREVARTGRKRLIDVNLIPKKEAIAYLERNMPSDINEAETYRMLINLIERGLIDAGYQNGHVAYQARALDPFTALVSVVSTSSEQEIKTMLPELRKMTEKYKEELKTPFKKGTISEPIIEALKNLQNFTACEIKSVRAHSVEELYKKERFKEIALKISEYFSILSESETRISNTKIDEMLIEINKLLEEEERKILEDERWSNQFVEIFEKLSNDSIPEIKRALSELRKQLEEK